MEIQELIASINIAEELDKQDLDRIGAEALQGYLSDEQSRHEWVQRNTEWIKLAAQVVEKKSWPWEGASNVKYPLVTTAAIQFHARAYPALLPSGDNLVRTRVIGFDETGEKTEKAIRIGKHMSWQLSEKMEDWDEGMDSALIQLPIVGCGFKKTFYSPTLGRNVSEFVPAKDLVVDYWAKTIETAQRKTHIIYLTENDVVERIRGGLYRDVDLEKRNQTKEDRASDEISGLSNSGSYEDMPYTVYEQHTWLDLDEDGYKEPYIVTIDEAGQVLRIVAAYDADSITFNQEDEIIRIEQEQYFTKLSFIPNPDGGFYDIGFGVLLGPTNAAANTIINQLVDAGTLSNLQSGYIGRGARIKKGDTSFKPGEWKQINASGDDLRKNIFPLPVREPSGVLFNLLGTLLDSGNRLASTTEMMVGENPGQNQPATTTLAVIEQGMKVFTAIYKRLYRSLKKEYKKLFILNSQYLDEEEYFTILDVGSEEAAQIARADYDTSTFDVVPAADPNVITEAQRLAKAQALLEMIPLGTVNPQEATARVLSAMQQPAIERLMQMPPPPPNPEVELEMQREQREQMKLQIDAELRGKELAIREMEAISKIQERNQNMSLKEIQAAMDERKFDLEIFKTMKEAEEKGNQYDEGGNS